MPKRKSESPEEGWLRKLRMDLLRLGRKATAVLSESLEAGRQAPGPDGTVISLGPDYQTRLKAVGLLLGAVVPRRAERDGEVRPILHIHAGAKVQMMFFGEVIEPAPEVHSPELKAQLIRSGRLLPDGTAPETAKATEATKVLPEPNPKRDGWLKGAE